MLQPSSESEFEGFPSSPVRHGNDSGNSGTDASDDSGPADSNGQLQSDGSPPMKFNAEARNGVAARGKEARRPATARPHGRLPSALAPSDAAKALVDRLVSSLRPQASGPAEAALAKALSSVKQSLRNGSVSDALSKPLNVRPARIPTRYKLTRARFLRRRGLFCGSLAFGYRFPGPSHYQTPKMRSPTTHRARWR